MKALWIVLTVLLLLVLLGLIRVGVHVAYDGALRLRILVGKLNISLPKEKKPKKRAAKEKKPETREKPQEARSDGKDWLQAALAHWQDILSLLGRVLHMPKLDPLILHVTAGGPDPAARALNYGRAWAVLGGVLPVLENTFRIGKREIGVRCGENQEEFTFYAETGLTVRIYEILLLGILGLQLLLKIYRYKFSSVGAARRP